MKRESWVGNDGMSIHFECYPLNCHQGNNLQICCVFK